MVNRINRRELAQMYRGMGAAKATAQLTEWLEDAREGREGGIKPEEFSLRDLAEAIVGYEWVNSLMDGTESGSAVNTTDFANITGQIVFSAILAAYNGPEFLFSRLIPNRPTRLSGEKIPGVTQIGDKAAIVKELMDYPTFGVGEEYIETPETEKRGLIVPVSNEAIFFDRTNLILDRCRGVGEYLALNKEKRLIDVAIGATNNYKRNGSTLNTYLTSGAWVNDISNPLTDWADIEEAELLFDAMVDPNTGELINVMPNTLIVSGYKLHTARRLLTATEVRHRTQSSNVETVSANPVGGAYAVEKSSLMRQRIIDRLSVSATNAREYWFLGDFSRAFAYMENIPVTVTQAAPNSEDSFKRDVVAQFKAMERGAAAVIDPRYVVRCKN